MFDLREDGNDGLGRRGRLLGVSDVDLSTYHDGVRIFDRDTVAQIYKCTLGTFEHRQRDAVALIGRHFSVSYGGSVTRVGAAASAVTQADILAIITQGYQRSRVFRSLLNAFDTNAIETHSIRISIEHHHARPLVRRESNAFRVNIGLPASPGRLPTILSEGGLVQMSLSQAVLETVIEATFTALARYEPPKDVVRDRGGVIGLANMAQLEIGSAYLPRVNAAFYGLGDGSDGGVPEAEIGALHKAIVQRCEWEDQLLERMNVFGTLDVAHDLYQGESIASRPTVRGVIDLLGRIEYPQAVYANTQPESVQRPGQAWTLFSRCLEVRADEEHLLIERLKTLVDTSFTRSLLFRTLLLATASVATPQSPRQIVCEGDGTPQASASAAYRRVDLTERRFLGLARTRPDDSARQVPEGPLHTLDPLQNLFTEVIDSLIDMHKTAADPAHQALPAPGLPSLQHRGAAVWAADLILMQIGRDPLKRLADSVAPQGDTLTASLLDAYAASNRRWARVEDAVIWQWLSQFDRSGNDTRFDAN